MAKIITNIKTADSIKEKALGLILNPNQRMLFQTRFGIHTCFMSRAIDVVILDNSNKVMKLKQGLKPWKFFFWSPQFNQVLELPVGEVKKFGIKLGDKIQLSC